MAGNLIGPLVFKEEDAPRYLPGFLVVVITSLMTGVLAIVYRFVCLWQNRSRDRQGTTEGFDHAYEDDLTDAKVRDKSPPSLAVGICVMLMLQFLQNPQFRYVY